MALPPLSDEPKILDDAYNTWTVENWRNMGKKEHGPIFQAGGYPWCVTKLDPAHIECSRLEKKQAVKPDSDYMLGEFSSFLTATTQTSVLYT